MREVFRAELVCGKLSRVAVRLLGAFRWRLSLEHARVVCYKHALALIQLLADLVLATPRATQHGETETCL